MQQLSRFDHAYFWDMLDASRKIQTFIKDMTLETYLEDHKTQSAVERQIEIIGEAARKVSQDSKNKLTTIPWRQMIGQRNILAHEYGAVESELVWEVANLHIPLLIKQLEPLIPTPPKVDR